jgi:ligand-binding SRPBCC domain-containing protein
LKVHRLEREQLVPLAPAQAFAFFGDAANLEPLTPPWLKFRVLTPQPLTLGAGVRIDYRLVLHGFPLRWTSEIVEWEDGVRFVDVQRRGPYRLWEHTHSFEPVESGTLLRDVVRYAIPLGPIGAIADVAFVRRDLTRIFDYRRDAAQRLMVAMGAPAKERGPAS